MRNDGTDTALESKGRILRQFVPDERDLPVQPFRSRAERFLANRLDELGNPIIIDVFGGKPTGACITRKTGQPDLDSPAGMRLEQLEPCGGSMVTCERRLAGMSPLALSAARKSDRILARRLVVIPTATGLTVASPALSALTSTAMAAGSSPNRAATRFTAETRSRARVAESPFARFRAVSTSARVAGWATRSAGADRGFLSHAILLSGSSGLVPSGLGRTGGDRSGNSGYSPC